MKNDAVNKRIYFTSAEIYCLISIGDYYSILGDYVDLCQYLGHKKLNAFLPNYIRENVFQADKASSSTC